MNYSKNEFIKHLKLGTGVSGSAFINNADVSGSKGIYSYFSSFDEFLKTNPDSKINEAKFDNYFSSLDDIEILLFREPVRLLKNIPILEQIELTIKFAEKTYISRVDKSTLVNFYDIDLHEMAMNNNKWIRFVDKFIFDPEKRAQFLKRFVEVR